METATKYGVEAYPGWIYDSTRDLFTSEDSESFTTTKDDDFKEYALSAIFKLANRREHVWLLDFQNTNSNKCCLIRFNCNSTYKLNAYARRNDGTVVSVRWNKTIWFLYVPREGSNMRDKYYDVLTSVIQSSIYNPGPTKLSSGFVEKCKLCFVYHDYSVDGIPDSYEDSRNSRHFFPNFVGGLTEFIRSGREMKEGQLKISSFDYVSSAKSSTEFVGGAASFPIENQQNAFLSGDYVSPLKTQSPSSSKQKTITRLASEEHDLPSEEAVKSYLQGCDGAKIPMFTQNTCGYRKIHIGCEEECSEMGHVILLLGATGSGKTTLINFITNYHFGSNDVEEDKIFVEKINEKTDSITAYTFHCHGEDKPIPVTVIDTPGLNDMSGAEIHDNIGALKSFIAHATSHNIDIHAIGFVAQAHLVRLTSSERMVINHIRSLFGEIGEKHLITLVTFSDLQLKPPIIDAVEDYGIKDPYFVKFNNSILTSESVSIDEIDRITWRNGFKSWKRCLKKIVSLGLIPVEAFANVKQDVFADSVVSKHEVALKAEIANLKDMWRRIQPYPQGMLQQRTIVWKVSNTAYYLSNSSKNLTKEEFLLNFCSNKFGICDNSFFLLLLLDKDTSFNIILDTVFRSFIDMTKKLANRRPKNEAANLMGYCCQCCRSIALTKKSFQNSRNVVQFDGTCYHDAESIFPCETSTSSCKMPKARLLKNVILESLQYVQNATKKFHQLEGLSLSDTINIFATNQSKNISQSYQNAAKLLFKA